MSEPAQIKVKARELRPYHHGIWCSIEGGTPFTNEIVIVAWMDDGKRIKCMLESHNFLTGLDPDEEVEVVPLNPSKWYVEKYGAWTLGPPPPPVETIETLRAELAALKASLAPIPGVTDGTRDNEPYTLEDCAAIEAKRGKPYTRLRRTVEALNSARSRAVGSDYVQYLESLAVEMKALKAQHADELRAVAERQREADLTVIRRTPRCDFHEHGCELDSAVDTIYYALKATPLVTEEK